MDIKEITKAMYESVFEDNAAKLNTTIQNAENSLTPLGTSSTLKALTQEGVFHDLYALTVTLKKPACREVLNQRPDIVYTLRQNVQFAVQAGNDTSLTHLESVDRESYQASLHYCLQRLERTKRNAPRFAAVLKASSPDTVLYLMNKIGLHFSLSNKQDEHSDSLLGIRPLTVLNASTAEIIFPKVHWALSNMIARGEIPHADFMFVIETAIICQNNSGYDNDIVNLVNLLSRPIEDKPWNEDALKDIKTIINRLISLSERSSWVTKGNARTSLLLLRTLLDNLRDDGTDKPVTLSSLEPKYYNMIKGFIPKIFIAWESNSDPWVIEQLQAIADIIQAHEDLLTSTFFDYMAFSRNPAININEDIMNILIRALENRFSENMAQSATTNMDAFVTKMKVINTVTDIMHTIKRRSDGYYCESDMFRYHKLATMGGGAAFNLELNGADNKETFLINALEQQAINVSHEGRPSCDLMTVNVAIGMMPLSVALGETFTLLPDTIKWLSRKHSFSDMLAASPSTHNKSIILSLMT